MIPLGDEFQERSVVQPFQFRLLRWLVRSGADKVLRFRRNGESRPRFWNLVEQPGIDRAGFRHAMGPFVMHERLPEKFAHPAVDFPRAEVAVIEKNLEL